MKKCLTCGKEFNPSKFNKSTQKYCSFKCQQSQQLPYQRLWRYKNKDKILAIKHIKDQKIRNKLLQLIGNKCIICNTQKCIQFHEKNGKEHKFQPQYYFDHPKDFVPLCYFCHKTIHRYAIIRSSISDELIELLRKKDNESCNS